MYDEENRPIYIKCCCAILFICLILFQIIISLSTLGIQIHGYINPGFTSEMKETLGKGNYSISFDGDDAYIDENTNMWEMIKNITEAIRDIKTTLPEFSFCIKKKKKSK